MGLSWADVKEWTDAGLNEAIAIAEDARKAASNQAAELASHKSSIASTGQAPSDMRSALDAIQGNLDARVNELSELMMACAEAYDGVRVVIAKADSCKELSASLGCTISDDGTVSALVNDDGVSSSKHEELTELLSETLTEANRVDVAFAARLKALGDGTYSSNENHASASPGLVNNADSTWTPRQVSAWWNSLTEAERQACIEGNPKLYGNLDGIDMASRAAANDLVLNGRKDASGNRIPGTSMLDEAQAEYDRVKALYDEAQANPHKYDARGEGLRPNPHKDELEAAQHRLDELNLLVKRLGPEENELGAEENKDASLIALDDSGDRLKAAIAFGDVDNAAHVATLVPGMGTNVHDSVERYMDTAQRLRVKAAEQARIDLSDVATIAWLDYDAPPDFFKTGDTSVASVDLAKAGGQRLTEHVTGIDAWRQERGMSVHQTAVTHSYGSTTGGFAMRDIGRGVVDDFIYTGSPGSAVQSVERLGVESGHVYVSAVPSLDAVQGIGPDGSFGRNPDQLEGIEHLSGDTTGAQDHKNLFEFRYDRWWLAPTALGPLAVTDIPNPFGNHSTYFSPAQQGQHNVAFDDISRVVGGC